LGINHNWNASDEDMGLSVNKKLKKEKTEQKGKNRRERRERAPI